MAPRRRTGALGYTAQAALDDRRVRSLTVIDAPGEVIGWRQGHRGDLVPLVPRLTSAARCRLWHGDFFALASGSGGRDPEEPGRRFHVILLDVDHLPCRVLHPRQAALCRPPAPHLLHRLAFRRLL
ncbi:hypothetical protein ACH5A2_21535 [Streptomyces collinus]|uniref:hypothetical protein n=1 Tax=Streptomyces collinus TaxID=42684 RepID=UPI0037A53F04